MRRILTPFVIALTLIAFAASAEAACYADYKAKKDSPLRLHYGVIELNIDCGDRQAVRNEIARRIARGDWQLLDVVSTFGSDGLEQRKGSAGEFFLRF